MHLVIPSRGRAGRVHTLNNEWPEWAIRFFELWVPLEELDEYKLAHPNVTVIGFSVEGIGKKRQAAVTFHNKVIMMDDDLTFYRRRDDDRTKFLSANAADLSRMLHMMMRALHYVPVAGVACREGGNRVIEPFAVDTRILRCFALDCDWIAHRGLRFDRLPLMEDFDMWLQVLEYGGHTLLINDYVHNQAGSAAVGGCSSFRTPQLQAECAQELATLHPQGVVQVVRKVAKTGLGDRTDVRIQWKKAYNGNGNAGVLDAGALADIAAQDGRGASPVDR